MGKKSKKKIQWRKLSLNELRSKSLSDEDCDDEATENINSDSPTPSSDSRSRNSYPRRSFHHSRDQNRFPHDHPPLRHNSSTHQKQLNHHYNFDQNKVFLERGVSAERCPSKSFNRSFYQDNRTHFPPGQKRRQFKHFGSQGGFFTQGYSPFSGDQGPRRRWSEDDSLALEDSKEKETEDVAEDDDKPSQPVHTVFIDNEEYTKIQTPRQEVIFKKSSLDKRRDSVDLGSPPPPSSCPSVTGCEPSSQGDQVSLAGSVEEPVLIGGDEPQCDEMQENRPYEDTNNLFTGDPGAPPLAGVVMQQAYPGGPMIPIPVHWTQFLNPGLIPGDTALTPLDPSFTHVIDPKDLPVDPAHILPVQHDSNGCPVTVQVRVNENGQPVEIEPSAFTVSLSTLEPRQQEVILQKNTDILPSSNISCSEPNISLCENEELEIKKSDNGSCSSSEQPEQEQAPKETDSGNKDSNEAPQEQNYDCTPDSQYATMSEASTAPTTPSGELSDITESAVPSKSDNDESTLNSYTENKNKLSRLDSLLETEPSEDDYCEDLDNFTFKAKDIALMNSHCSLEDKTDSTTDVVEALQPPCMPLLVSETLLINQSSSTDIVCDQISNAKLSNEIDSCNLCLNNVDKTCLESASREDNTRQNKKKKTRCNSIDSTISSQTSSVGDNLRSESDSVEPPSKYKVKKNARKLKKEKKRLSKERNKAKVSSTTNLMSESSTETESSNFESSSITLENTPEKEADLNVSSSEVNVSNDEVNVSNETGNTCSDNNEDSVAPNDLEDKELNKEHDDSQETAADTDSSGSPTEKSEEEGGENEIGKVSSEKESNNLSAQDNENYICTQGFVMVPILTPYYDPAVLYGYPVIVPENAPERNYNTSPNNNNNKKKKKKHRKRFHEENYLDTELYAGEPFVATPNGYVVPMDASRICQLHGYQFLPNMFPHIMPDEEFGSIYMHENFCHEVSHRRLNGYGERERRNRYSKHYEEYRRKVGVESQQQQDKYTLPKDIIESADSGVSEPEELSHLNPTKRANEVNEGIEGDNENSSKKCKATKSSANFSNETDQAQNLEDGKSKNSKKRKKNRKKNKKDIVEILEPDFSSFDGPTPRFEVSKTNEQGKPKPNKNIKSNKKKENNIEEDAKIEENELPSSNKSKKSKNAIKNSTAKNYDNNIASSSSSPASPSPAEKIIKANSKLNTKNKKANKAKNKNKSQKLDKKESETSVAEKEELHFAEVSNQSENLLNCSLSHEDEISSAQVSEIPQTEEIHLEESSAALTEENFACINSSGDQYVLSQESGICVESEESLNYNESYDASILSQEEEELNANEREAAEQSDENKDFQELDNESYTKGLEKETTSEDVSTCSDNEVTSENVVICSDNDMTSDNIVTCSDNEMTSEVVVTCSNNELSTSEKVVTCSDIEITSEKVVTCFDNEITSEKVVNCFDNEVTSEKVVNCSDNGLAEKVVTCSDTEIISENVVTYTIDTEEIVPEDCEISQTTISTEVEDHGIFFDDTIPTNELDSESLQKNTSNLVTPKDIQSHSDNFIKDNVNIVSNANLDSKCDNSTLEIKDELTPSSSETQIVSFKDLGVTEAVKRWIRDVTPEKAFCITDETRSIIFAKSEFLEIESEEESDCEEMIEASKTKYQSKNVLSNPFVASPSESSLGVSSERVAYSASSLIRETEKNKTVQKRNSTNSQDLDNFDRESLNNFSRERLFSSSSCSSFPLCPSEDSSTLLDDPRVYDPSVYSKYYQLGADIQIPPSNSSTRESTLSPSFVESEDVDFCSGSESTTPTENYSVSIATELLKSEKIRANMAHISPSFCKDHLPMPHCGSTASCSEINSEVYIKTEKEIEASRPDYSGPSSGIGSSLASTPNTSPYHQFPTQTTNCNSKPKLEPHPLVNLSAGQGPLPCRTMCCSVM